VHVLRVGFVAELLARHGTLVLVPVIAPYADTRDSVRRHHDEHGSTSSRSTCPHRWPNAPDATRKAVRQGKQRQADRTDRVDDRYDEPVDPDLRIDTTDIDVPTAADRVLELLAERKLLD